MKPSDCALGENCNCSEASRPYCSFRREPTPEYEPRPTSIVTVERVLLASILLFGVLCLWFGFTWGRT